MLNLIALLAAAAVLLVGAVAAVRWWTWRPMMKRKVLVQTDADVTFEGAVLSRRGPLLVMGGVTVRTGTSSNRADGTVVIERSRVLWVQVV